MKEYAVEITQTAEAALHAHARYIAVEKREPMEAIRWLESAIDGVRSLRHMPMRCSLAEENSAVAYEVRQLLVGSPALLLTIDEERQTVWVFAFRGQGQLPRLNELPPDLGSIRRK
ncbi:MAG: type II toxin-antitoxin system RelE/ParE family toxin [Cyanobacteria bacterium J06648_11]